MLHLSLFFLQSENSFEFFSNMAFSEKYFLFLEISFNYVIKYIVFTTLYTRVNSGSEKLRKFFQSLNYNDCFIDLFNSISVCSDIEHTWELVIVCAKQMETDFFLSGYKDAFIEICREIILEKIILLSSKINLG